MMLRDTSGTSDAARHAALLLHAMPAQDRSWALAQLPESQQTLLADLLKELQDLGIPRDRKLIDQAVASMTTPQAPTVTSLLQLDPTGVHALSELLGKEPALLVARLLSCGPWTWEGELLTKLAPAQRRQVEKLRAQLPPRLEAQPLKDALVQKIEEHLFRAAPPIQTPTPVPRRSFGLPSALRRAGTTT